MLGQYARSAPGPSIAIRVHARTSPMLRYTRARTAATGNFPAVPGATDGARPPPLPASRCRTSAATSDRSVGLECPDPEH
jgi:hypothetical protein